MTGRGEAITPDEIERIGFEKPARDGRASPWFSPLLRWLRSTVTSARPGRTGCRQLLAHPTRTRNRTVPRANSFGHATVSNCVHIDQRRLVDGNAGRRGRRSHLRVSATLPGLTGGGTLFAVLDDYRGRTPPCRLRQTGLRHAARCGGCHACPSKRYPFARTYS